MRLIDHSDGVARTSQPMSHADPVALAQALIRCPSVTPKDEGALDVLEAALKPLGFACHRLRFEQDGTRADRQSLCADRNAAARISASPATPTSCRRATRSLWRHDPFAREIENGTLYGRGAADMKSAIAAFVAAAARYLAGGKPLKGSISLLITGDEEGPAINGTPKMLDWLKERGETLDHCIVGEPTSTARAGDTLKIGRRGSMNARVTRARHAGPCRLSRTGAQSDPGDGGAGARACRRMCSTRARRISSRRRWPSPPSMSAIRRPTSFPPRRARSFNIRFNDSHTPDVD